MNPHENAPDYVFCHRNGRLQRAKANPLRPESWPFKREEIAQVFADCTAQFLSVVSNNYVQNQIKELTDYIHRNYPKALTMDFALKMTGMSKSNFCRRFKQETGMSLIAYINKVRLEQAARLLRETDLPCTTIGYDCGFSTLSVFYKLFKEGFGRAPGEFRYLLT